MINKEYINNLDLTVDQVKQFINEKKIKSSCDQCGHADATVIYSDNENCYSGLVSQLKENGMLDGAFPVIMVMCKNCGYLRLFMVNFIKSYFAQKTEEENGR